MENIPFLQNNNNNEKMLFCMLKVGIHYACSHCYSCESCLFSTADFLAKTILSLFVKNNEFNKFT